MITCKVTDTVFWTCTAEQQREAVLSFLAQMGSAMQRQTAVAASLKSEQLLLFAVVQLVDFTAGVTVTSVAADAETFVVYAIFRMYLLFVLMISLLILLLLLFVCG